MDNASDNWFTLDVAGDATVAADASAKDKSSEDLERLVFGDNFSSRLKAQKSIVPAAKEKPQSKDRAKKSVSRQQKKTGRPAAAAASDDGDSSSAGDVAASSDGDARSSDLVKATSDSGRLRAAAWQDEDDDAIQVQPPHSTHCYIITYAQVGASSHSLCFRSTCRPSRARRSCARTRARLSSAAPSIRSGCASSSPSCTVLKAGHSPRQQTAPATVTVEKTASKLFSLKGGPSSTKGARTRCDAAQLMSCAAPTLTLPTPTLPLFRA